MNSYTTGGKPQESFEGEAISVTYAPEMEELLGCFKVLRTPQQSRRRVLQTVLGLVLAAAFLVMWISRGSATDFLLALLALAAGVLSWLAPGITEKSMAKSIVQHNKEIICKIYGDGAEIWKEYALTRLRFEPPAQVLETGECVILLHGDKDRSNFTYIPKRALGGGELEYILDIIRSKM